jgi:hypothetical protein
MARFAGNLSLATAEGKQLLVAAAQTEISRN